MKLSITYLGNHANFDAYLSLFDSIYKAKPVTDILGNEVVFGHPRFNGSYDCHHVCYGGAKADWGDPVKWKQERAERILWIGPALSDPGIKIYQDPGYPNRRRYLSVIDADPPKGTPTEYFCVIAEVINVRQVAFITAYDITREKWEEYKRVAPRYYPPPKPSEGGKKKKQKGTV